MTGAELRDKGLEQAGSGGPVAMLAIWVWKAENAILDLCEAESDFTSEDVRRAVGDPPHHNVIGAVFRSMARKGIIVPAGVGIASRPSRHASLIRTWRRA